MGHGDRLFPPSASQNFAEGFELFNQSACALKAHTYAMYARSKMFGAASLYHFGGALRLVIRPSTTNTRRLIEILSFARYHVLVRYSGGLHPSSLTF